MNREEYAVDLLQVREIVRYESRDPRTPRPRLRAGGRQPARQRRPRDRPGASGSACPKRRSRRETCLVIVEVMVGGDDVGTGPDRRRREPGARLPAAGRRAAALLRHAVPAAFLLGTARCGGPARLSCSDLDRLLAEGALLHGRQTSRAARCRRAAEHGVRASDAASHAAGLRQAGRAAPAPGLRRGRRGVRAAPLRACRRSSAWAHVAAVPEGAPGAAWRHEPPRRAGRRRGPGGRRSARGRPRTRRRAAR